MYWKVTTSSRTVLFFTKIELSFSSNSIQGQIQSQIQSQSLLKKSDFLGNFFSRVREINKMSKRRPSLPLESQPVPKVGSKPLLTCSETEA